MGFHPAFTVFLLALLPLFGCATNEGNRLDRRALRQGLEVLAVSGGDFPLRAYVSPGARAGEGPLHLYLEGDGRPWIDGRFVAADPHGRNNVAFDLMLKDPAPAAYLQRPCYHRLEDRSEIGSRGPRRPCRPELWTHGRYSETVVSSLAAGIEGLSVELGRSDAGLVLIGFSGGGVLAHLLASRIEGVQALVTIAANLDVEAWASHHGFEPLEASLNPAVEPPLPAALPQIHWLGGEDSNVPVELITAALEHQPGARVEIIPEFNHICCWVDRWPELLESSLGPRPSLGPRTSTGSLRR